ncbi:MAG TPA: radical SAM family heme chaperone HemW [Nitrospira sp.]|jgi:oxygen-independent coproporphyrinogen-3 oxidase|nr:radical SAM family heme chaperone HemW [Nitrospira sp.]
MTPPLGLYVHIPFCRQRCHFCAFYLELHREAAADEFMRALGIELRRYADEPSVGGRLLGSVYIGGGTPTVLTAGQLTGVLEKVRGSFPLHPDCEITVEAHPGTVTDAYLSVLRGAGVTRLSFGAESMHDAELVRIGRPGGGTETIAAVAAARRAGFTNINLDLMYGLPGQTIETWKRSLSACCELFPTHLSCYALTVEPGTRLAHDIRRERLPPLDESVQIQMDDAAGRMLAGAGYLRYEISNYAKPRFECRHNLLYWTQGEYLGIGPSAQSFIGGVRFGNIADLTAYEAALAQGRLPIEGRTELSPREQLRDAVIFGLRLERGILTSQLNGHALNYGYLPVIQALRRQKLLEDQADRTRLSPEGRLHADTVAEKLF